MALNFVDQLIREHREKNGLENNETWTTMFGREFENLFKMTHDDLNLKQLNAVQNGLYSNYLDTSDLETDDVINNGLRNMLGSLTCQEYPKVELTVAVIRIITKGMETSVISSSTIMLAHQIVSQLLRILSPKRSDFKKYWQIVFGTIIGGHVDESAQEFLSPLVLRVRFIGILWTILSTKSEGKRRAAAAFLDILCKMLEIDFARFLSRHPKDASTNLLIETRAPLIASMFWPHGMVHIAPLQGDLLKPIMEMISKENQDDLSMEMHKSASHLLAMIVEMTRLSHKGETVDVVNFQETPMALYRMLVDIPCMSSKSALSILRIELPFGWFKDVIEKRLQEASGKYQ